MPKNKPLSAHLDKKKVEATVKEILKDGTPGWVSHPEDYKNWFEEEEEADHERSCESAKQYKFEDQQALTDEDSSLVRFLNVNNFISILRRNGIAVQISQTQPQTCGLWCIRPSQESLGFQFVTSMQVPVMPEWGLLHEEEHGIANGEAAIGWRQVLAQMALKRIASETKLHGIPEFGPPISTARSQRYRRTLNAVRNGRFNNE